MLGHPNAGLAQESAKIWHARYMNLPQRTILDSQSWELLSVAHANYTSSLAQTYDEVLYQVAERIRTSGSIGKSDIGALPFRKRLRANTACVRDLMVKPEKEVRAVTEKAVSA